MYHTKLKGVNVVVIRCGLFVLLMSCALVNVSYGEVHTKKSKAEVNADISENANNQVSSDSGVVDADVEMTGYAVINGEVWIDGIKVNKPQSVYVSKKNGKTYRIRWGKNGNVSVTEE